jgi:hypothetical protein
VVVAVPLDSLARALLVAVDRLTRDDYGQTDGDAVMAELERLGETPSEDKLRNLARRLRDEGYLELRFAGGSPFRSAGFIELTKYGRSVAHEIDPFERTQLETRGLIASEGFREAYPATFEAWADAERLLWVDDANAQLTTVGHKVREAMQAFATAMVNEHQPPDVDSDPAHARKRLGAVIAAVRPQLGDARRLALEALGDLWEATDALVQRQEHGAQKEREAVTWTDARRLVWLTMFLMVEFATTFEDLPDDPPAHLEGG